MYHKKEGKFYTICMVTKVATICVRYVPQKRRQVLYYTFGHKSCHYLFTLCTTKKKASSTLYVWSQKLPLFVYAMYHKKEGKFYTIRLVTKVATFCVRYVPQKSRQVLY